MKELIERIVKRLDRLIELSLDKCDGGASENAYKICKDIIHEEATDYNNGWIPVSERLPDCEHGEESEPLFYQMKHTGTIEAGYFGRGGRWRDMYFRHYRDGMEGMDVSCVIAWRHQKPYKPKGE